MSDLYKPATITATLGHVVEEAGEVQAAIGKTLRFGLYSVNPELPTPPDGTTKEMNIDWVLRELKDLKKAIERAEHLLVYTSPDDLQYKEYTHG